MPKLRLTKEEGKDSLRSYLKKRFTLKTLADKIGTSNQNLHDILSGSQKRPNRFKLQELADSTGLHLDYDEGGEPYFDTNSSKAASGGDDSIREEQLEKVIHAKYSALPPERRKMVDLILDFMLDPEKSGEKKKLISEMIRMFNEQ
jgi:transcriptional regulator with XRE-family HTH domain